MNSKTSSSWAKSPSMFTRPWPARISPTTRTLSMMLNSLDLTAGELVGHDPFDQMSVPSPPVHSMDSSLGMIHRFTCWVVHSDVATVGMPSFM